VLTSCTPSETSWHPLPSSRCKNVELGSGCHQERCVEPIEHGSKSRLDTSSTSKPLCYWPGFLVVPNGSSSECTPCCCPSDPESASLMVGVPCPAQKSGSSSSTVCIQRFHGLRSTCNYRALGCGSGASCLSRFGTLGTFSTHRAYRAPWRHNRKRQLGVQSFLCSPTGSASVQIHRSSCTLQKGHLDHVQRLAFQTFFLRGQVLVSAWGKDTTF